MAQLSAAAWVVAPLIWKVIQLVPFDVSFFRLADTPTRALVPVVAVTLGPGLVRFV